jgi:hypothetical protein
MKMNFERGGDIKESIGIGLKNQMIKINYCSFSISIYDTFKKRISPISSMGIDCYSLDDIIKSTKGILELLHTVPIKLGDLQNYLIPKSKLEKNHLKKYLKDKDILTLKLDVGVSGYLPNLYDLLEKVKYLKYQGEIYPLADGPLLISYEGNEFPNLLQRISAKILGVFRK